MADIKDRESRSRNMAAIKNKDTKPEMYIRKLLFNRGYRFRKNVAGIIGHPDIWLPKYNTAIFVHGCYWHRHNNCKYAYMPKSHVEFWTKKFNANIARDNNIIIQLNDNGVKCLIIWECAVRYLIRHKEIENEFINKIKEFFDSKNMFIEIGRNNLIA